jgi:hypothetical protein
MKFSKEKIEYISDKSENLYRVFHEGEVFTFETPVMGIPFGVDQEYGKTKCRLEFPSKSPESWSTQHKHIKKIVEKIEKYVCERFDVKGDELKSVFRTREGHPDLMECRIKETKGGAPLTKVQFENKSDNYLKTIYTVPERSKGMAKMEWFGVFDFREENGGEGNDAAPQNTHKVGIILNILHLRVMESS